MSQKSVGEIKKNYDREGYVFDDRVQQEKIYKNNKLIGYGKQVMPRPENKAKNEEAKCDEKDSKQKNINQIAEEQEIYEDLYEKDDCNNLAEAPIEAEERVINNISEKTETKTPNENYDTGQNYTQKREELDEGYKHDNLVAAPIKTKEKMINDIDEETETQTPGENGNIEQTYVQREREEEQRNNVKAMSAIYAAQTENANVKKVGFGGQLWFLPLTFVSNPSLSVSKILLRIYAVSTAVRFTQENEIERQKRNIRVVSKTTVVRAKVVDRKKSEIKVQARFLLATLVSNSTGISLRVCAVFVAVRLAQKEKIENQKGNMESGNVYSSFSYLEYRVMSKNNQTNSDNMGTTDERENTPKYI